MAEISIEEMNSLVNDGVVGASEFTEWISIRACKFACDGDLAALSLALDEGADPNLADDDGKNPLIYAARVGHEHCVARLLEAGADPNCAASGRESVLMFAACSGHARCVARLLEAGADPNYKLLGRSVLEHTVLASHAGAVEALLAGGADARPDVEYTRNLKHLPPLNFRDAVSDPCSRSHRHGSGRIIPLLLRAGALKGNNGYCYRVRGDPSGFSPSITRRLNYLHAVQAAGGFPSYARAHRSIFVAIFSRGTLLPTAVLLTIVEYWAHLGWYQYHVPGTTEWVRRLSLRRITAGIQGSWNSGGTECY